MRARWAEIAALAVLGLQKATARPEEVHVAFAAVVMPHTAGSLVPVGIYVADHNLAAARSW
jgi:hypothetical protein